MKLIILIYGIFLNSILGIENLADSYIEKGWFKYAVTSLQNSTKSVTSFEINPSFFQQFTNTSVQANLFQEDKFGTIDIPSSTSFFFVLTDRTLYILYARRVLTFSTNIIENF